MNGEPIPVATAFPDSLREHLAPVNAWGSFRVGSRPAAVVAALFEDDGRWWLPFVARRADAPSHPGQVALPGGGVRPGEDAWAGAARECSEEIGVPPDTLRPLGAGTMIYTAVSNYSVIPFVGVVEGPRPAFVHQESELDAVIEIPLLELLREQAWLEAEPGSWFGRHFPWEGHVVWGLTAYILADLLPRFRAALGS
ncbi:MAG TPA: CoA pyrophosphatase [Candidatus Dormibacteraeota bacterium]